MKMESIVAKIAGIFGETITTMPEGYLVMLRSEAAGAMIGAAQFIEHP